MVPLVDFTNHLPVQSEICTWHPEHNHLPGYDFSVISEKFSTPKTELKESRSDVIKKVKDKFLTKMFDENANLDIWDQGYTSTDDSQYSNASDSSNSDANDEYDYESEEADDIDSMINQEMESLGLNDIDSLIESELQTQGLAPRKPKRKFKWWHGPDGQQSYFTLLSGERYEKGE
jgi:hypothetical protein